MRPPQLLHTVENLLADPKAPQDCQLKIMADNGIIIACKTHDVKVGQTYLATITPSERRDGLTWQRWSQIFHQMIVCLDQGFIK